MVWDSKHRRMDVINLGCRLGIVGVLLSAAPGYAASIYTGSTVEAPIQQHASGLSRVNSQGDSPVEPLVLSQTVRPNPSSVEPDRDRFLQPVPLPSPLPSEDQAPVITPPSPAPPSPAPSPVPTGTPLPSGESVPIAVERIEVVGSTVFDAEDFAPIVQPAAEIGRASCRERV